MADLLTMSDKKNADKQKALDSALAQIERQFGKGSIMKLGEGAKQDIDASSTGSLGLDIALGIGGLPMGRIVEIWLKTEFEGGRHQRRLDKIATIEQTHNCGDGPIEQPSC